MKRTFIGYNVYHVPDGSAPSYYGRAKTLEEAKELAKERALEKSLWDTARTAGHCAGLTAPEGEEEEEATEWFGEDGFDCAVAVYGEGDEND